MVAPALIPILYRSPVQSCLNAMKSKRTMTRVQASRSLSWTFSSFLKAFICACLVVDLYVHLVLRDKEITTPVQPTGPVRVPESLPDSVIPQVSMCGATTSVVDRLSSENLSPMLVNQDDLRYGKSCSYNGTEQQWICRDCGLDCVFVAWADCPLLDSRGSPIKVTEYDKNAKLLSIYDSVSFDSALRDKILVGADQIERLPCRRGVLDPMCFDIGRCSPGPLKVFVYGNESFPLQYIQPAAKNHPLRIQHVHFVGQACLVVVPCDIHDKGTGVFRKVADLVLSGNPQWNEGKNHFIWSSHRCFEDRYDEIYSYRFHPQRAAVSHPNFDALSLRQGYDVPLPYFQKMDWTEFKLDPVKLTRATKKRKYLLTFKGGILPYPRRGYQHRRFAADYWDDAGDILLDAPSSSKLPFPYRLDESKYADYLLDSTFGFCPGGMSTGSFRFHETLALGAIPVVTSDFVAPFGPDLDWSDCIVRISTARVVDMPRILRLYTQEHVQRRQLRCKELFDKSIGWIKNDKEWKIDHGQQAFEMAMLVWHARVQSAFTQLSLAT